MITQPSCERTLEAIRDELRTTVAPACTDPAAQAALGMIDAMLASVIARCDHEVAWMREEIAEIEIAAAAVIDADADPAGRVADALAGLHGCRSASHHTADVRAEYNRAGEVLSCALEEGMRAGPDLGRVVRAVLEARLAREIEICGDPAIVGR